MHRFQSNETRGRQAGSAMMRNIGRMTVLMLVLTCILPFVAYHLAGGAAISALEGQLQRSLVLTNRGIATEIERFRYLPLVIGEDARIRALADRKRSAAALAAANLYLQTVVKQAGAAELYVLDDRGIALAASNFATPESFVGHDYSFRPYFQDALLTGEGRYYAIGVTTRKPGYFLTSRIDVPGHPPIVVVVKADLLPLEVAWKAAGVQTAIADRWGIVFLSGNPDWKYRPLSALSAEALERLRKERTYDGADLGATAPILPQSVTPPAGETDAPALQVEQGGQQLLARFSRVEPDGWLVLAATSTADTGKVAGFWALAVLIAGLVSTGTLYFLHQRTLLIRMRLRHSEMLEQKVAERTQDLAREIDMRRRTEDELRRAQEGLIHSEKMAALGRMSTAIVHEVSQPLAALETTLATAGVLAEKEAADKVGERLLDARALVKRMQRTVKHLKTFARKDASDLEAVNIDTVIRNAIDLAVPRAKTLGLTPALEAEGPAPVVTAVAVKLEQVMLNLILNALDAVEGRQTPSITVRRAVEAGRVSVAVIDNGSGIAPEHRDRIAEPFFTTKLTGEGLGLGLSIATAIVQEFGGELIFAEAPGGGTMATVSMPLDNRPALPLEAAQ
ncbi:two-component system C4-dicarboxylate transport sensor histidine kinase DctB [Sinorhizobium kostiense]|uniref:C4-dicarboxylate transport sensor protein n=1 Tax=Sinorhizobium kostiense TaxID=76747 RepID=A0ABS4QT87_9HYPH|nr:ATP-binding protein [Sinorhizobium kostiense]MBP2233875.1 two-component system C4-dicarboxylate transport sensor histidine kinase DctB [Sinorhizobium kostiense]